jgi:transcriptional regulator with XRE-family HTH domain
MDDFFTFGNYIYQKRRESKRSLREMALEIEITSAYLSELEKGKKTNPSREIMQRIIDILCLDDEEIALFYDLHAKANGIVSQDLPDYITGSGIVRIALLKAKKKSATNKDWQGFIDELE